jgi:HD-GYP domain-containing protein (c-di-GMP phosphodiesterase class II)
LFGVIPFTDASTKGRRSEMFDEIVKGVTVRKSGSTIERVNLRNTSWHLLASWDGTEVIRQEYLQGKSFGLRPQEGWNALECYYILEGEAVWEDGDRSVLLGPGDSLTGAPVKEPCILRAVTNLVTLYVCSQPSFHMVSEQVTYLQQLAVSVEEKDGYTADHCRRIRDLSMEVGQRLKLTPGQQYNLFHGAFLHDLGKVGVPDGILLKPGTLSDEEWRIMKQHPTIGGSMLVNTNVAPAAYILEQHHESIDGSGYPLGLRGDEISLEAKIVAVVDSYDAMITDRVYRSGMPKEAARKELQRNVGRLYQADVVETFLDVIDKY